VFIARQTEYKYARRMLKGEIRASKRECLLKLCDSAEHDPLCKAYKTVVKSIHAGRQLVLNNATELKPVVETLFPKRPLFHFEEPAMPSPIVEVTVNEI